MTLLKKRLRRLGDGGQTNKKVLCFETTKDVFSNEFAINEETMLFVIMQMFAKEKTGQSSLNTTYINSMTPNPHPNTKHTHTRAQELWIIQQEHNLQVIGSVKY